jgi:hypothetical protein
VDELYPLQPTNIDHNLDVVDRERENCFGSKALSGAPGGFSLIRTSSIEFLVSLCSLVAPPSVTVQSSRLVFWEAFVFHSLFFSPTSKP